MPVKVARVGARAAPDGVLRDLHEARDRLQPVDAAVASGDDLRAVELARATRAEDVEREGGLAGAGHAAEAREPADRNSGVEPLQVVFGGGPDADKLVRHGKLLRGAFHLGAPGEEGSGARDG